MPPRGHDPPMNTLRSTISGAILLMMASLVPIGAKAQVYTGPKCLGPACIDHNSSFESLVQQLGGSSSVGGAYGYRSSNTQAFLIITEGEHGELGSIDLRDFAEFGMWTGKDGKL